MVFSCLLENELNAIAKQIIKHSEDNTVWIFKGDLGAGKTTLIKYICNEMGVVDATSSPTFSLVNEYQTMNGECIYHFDFYRIDTEKEAFNIGTMEYFDSGDYCFIEWPEKIPNLLPDQYLEISIKFIGDKRTIELTKHGPKDLRD
ncbi:MAG: tRNA (adenosine(37)-N6)-threonylcarbamoyltransferase complex ATPase subunit type 1 TsaE [Cyclobacteriaceae bacterium]